MKYKETDGDGERWRTTQRDKMKEHNLVRKSLRKKDIGAYLVGKKKCRN